MQEVAFFLFKIIAGGVIAAMAGYLFNFVYPLFYDVFSKLFGWLPRYVVDSFLYPVFIMLIFCAAVYGILYVYFSL